MLDVKPLIVVDVSFISNLDPLFVGGFHAIVQEPVFGCRTLSDIDEVVADILVGEFAFPGTVYQTLSIIYCLKSSSVYVSVCAFERACARACVCVCVRVCVGMSVSFLLQNYWCTNMKLGTIDHCCKVSVITRLMMP